MKAKVISRVHVGGEWHNPGAVIEADPNTVRNLIAKGKLEAVTETVEKSGEPEGKKGKKAD